MYIYKSCKIAVSVDVEQSSSFYVNVGVHQGSALSSLLFFMVMDVPTEDVRGGSLMELLYVENLNLCGKSLNRGWKNAVEEKGLRVNIDKTKGMQLLFGKKSRVSKKDLCGACGE